MRKSHRPSEHVRQRLSRRYRGGVQRAVHRTFGFWEQLGVHLTPVHFYEPIPDSRTLPDEIWTRESDLVGIDMHPEEQLRRLARFSSRYQQEYSRFPLADPGDADPRFFIDNGSFESVDAEVLYCMIRESSPRRIIEIGAGSSTLLALEAMAANEANEATAAELLSIDPFPREWLGGVKGVTQIRSRVEDLPLSTFAELMAGDILFIDSSHVLRTGGDVAFEYLEILPRLAPGVLVHIHDIFLPRDYPRDWVLTRRRFWTEQYLLQAFLSFNSEFEVIWSSSYLHLIARERLAEAFPSYRAEDRWPGSFWIRRRA